jgi:hypothetical protein
MHRQPDLADLIGALRSPRRFTGGLHRWQEQRDKDANDGNDHQ